MSAYVKDHSIKSLLSSSFNILTNNFITLVSISAIAVVPFFLFPTMNYQSEYTNTVSLIFPLIFIIINYWSMGAMIVAISDICMGEEPTVLGSYKSVTFPLISKLFATNAIIMVFAAAPLLISTLFISQGSPFAFLLFIVTFIATFVIVIRYILITVITVLERDDNVWALSAIRRAGNLSDGWHVRNFIVLLIVGSAMLAVMGSVMAFSTLLSPVDMNLASNGTPLFAIAMAVVQSVITPLTMTVLVLMYFDLRVRKEGLEVNMVESLPSDRPSV